MIKISYHSPYKVPNSSTANAKVNEYVPSEKELRADKKKKQEELESRVKERKRKWVIRIRGMTSPIFERYLKISYKELVNELFRRILFLYSRDLKYLTLKGRLPFLKQQFLPLEKEFDKEFLQECLFELAKEDKRIQEIRNQKKI